MPSKTQAVDWIRVNALRSRRNQILEDIYHRESVVDGKEAEVEASKQEYNRLSRELEILLRKPPTDPLVSLPPEVWTDIIREAADDSSINLPSTDVLLLLTLVSNGWSRKILNTPGLWTNITIGRGEADAQAKLGAALCLSGSLQFNLTIKIVPCQWEAILSLLQVGAHRIKSVAVQNPYDYNDLQNQAKFIQHFFGSFTHLPALRVIRTADGLQLNWDVIFSKCPALSYIYGTLIPFEVLRNRNQVPIRACRIDAASDDVIPHLEDLAHLEELIWALGSDGPITRGYPLPALPNLRLIDSLYNQNTGSFIILKLTANLTSLALAISNSWDHLYDLFLHLNHLPHLLVLKLRLVNVRGKLSLPAIKPIQTGVQILRFGGDYHNTEFEEVDQEAFVNQETLFLVFPVCFPNVTQLSLDYGFFGPNVAAYIRCAAFLRSLSLAFVEIRPDYNIPIESSSLEVLDLEGDNVRPLDKLVSFIECPPILKLKFQDDMFWVRVSERDKFSIAIHNTMRLETSAQWEISKFTALRRLHILEGFSDDPSPNAVMIPLICDPHICPLLREVEFGFLPEWDLLFLMLERRNYLPHSLDIARIETLVLPSPIPPVLLAPLTEILSGRFIERPSNLELSFHGFMNAYFDASM